MIDLFKPTGSSVADISDQLSREIWVVGQMTECQIAFIAYHSSVPSGSMAMIDREPSIWTVVPATNVALCDRQHLLDLLFGKLIFLSQSTPDPSLGSSAIFGSVISSALVAVLGAISAHASIFARIASGFSRPSLSMIKAKMTQGKILAAATASLRFHSNSIAAVVGTSTCALCWNTNRTISFMRH